MAKAWVKIANLKGPKGDVGTWYMRVLATTDDVKSLPFGLYDCRSAAVATAIGLPVAAVGPVEVLPSGTAMVVRFTAVAPFDQVWEISRYANGIAWGEWRRTDFRKEQPEGLRAAPPAGMKTAPQAVTLGHGGAQVTGSGYARGLIRLAPTVSRIRVHLANRNPRYSLADDAAVSIPAITVGVHTGAGAQSTVATIATAASTGSNGYTSPWVDAAAYAGKDILIGYDYASAGTIQSNIGTGYGATGTTGAAGTGTAPKLQAMPLFVWVEVEVPAATPVIAAYGDSLSCGVGSSNVVYDSPVSQYARTIGAVPVHYAHSGDSMVSWDAAAAKWTMYGDLQAPADAVIFGMGSNDVFGGATLDDMKARFAAVMTFIRYRISPNVYGATLMPRTSVTGAMETVRRDYNTWLKVHPDLRKVFDFAASVSTDDETITPAYNADGTHLTTAGYTRNSGTLASIAAALATASSVGAIDGRLAVVESMAGLTPGELSDTTAAGLVNNPPTATRTAVDNAIRAITDPLNAGKLDKTAAATTYADIRSAAVSVKKFGAIGDGVSDDTPFLQSAIDSGKPLYWGGPGDVYRTTATLVNTLAPTTILWRSDGATVKLDSAASVEFVGNFDTVGKSVFITGTLTFDANEKAYSGLRFINTGAYANFRADNLTVKNCFRAAKAFTGGEGLAIRGAFTSVHLERPVVDRVHMAATAGTIGVSGSTGIFISAFGANYPRSIFINDPQISSIFCDDAAYLADQDGIKVFALDDDGTLYPFQSTANLIGGTYKNCRGRAIKSQLEMTRIVSPTIIRDENIVSPSPDIDFQVGGGTLENIECLYTNGYPKNVVNFTGPVTAGKITGYGSLDGLKVICTGTARITDTIAFTQRTWLDSFLIVRNVQTLGNQPDYIIAVSGLTNGKHDLAASDIFGAPVLGMVAARLGTSPGWVGNFLFDRCVNRGATAVPIVKRSTTTANPVSKVAASVINYSAQI